MTIVMKNKTQKKNKRLSYILSSMCFMCRYNLMNGFFFFFFYSLPAAMRSSELFFILCVVCLTKAKHVFPIMMKKWGWREEERCVSVYIGMDRVEFFFIWWKNEGREREKTSFEDFGLRLRVYFVEV